MSSRRIKAWTYRVEGIPPNTTRQELINNFFYKKDHQFLEVKSLCASVDDDGNDDDEERELTATVLFRPYNSQPEGPRLQNEDIQISKEFRGFTPLYVPPKAKGEIKADIIAVTGLAGHAFGSWAHSEDKMWLRDYLPKTASNARILTYGYDSTLVDSSLHNTLRDFTKRFLESLVTIRKSCEHRPIIFIGHSLGCIIIKKTITDFETVGLSRLPVRTIIFLASPNRGLENTALQTLVKGRPSQALINELSFNSPILVDINERFKTKAQGVNIHGFYERKPTRTVVQRDNGEWVRDGEPVMMVDQNSAILGLQNEKAIPVDSNHSEIAKVKKGQDGIYPHITGAIQEGLRSTMDVVKEATKNPEPRSYNVGPQFTDDGLIKGSKSRKLDDRPLFQAEGSMRSNNDRPREAIVEPATSEGSVDQYDEGDVDSLLHEAAASGDSSIVTMLLSKGVAVDSLDDEAQAAIHYSVANGEVEVTQILLQGGADANLADQKGNTPLHIATENDFIEIVELLLSHGCNPDEINDENQTPLLIATSLDQIGICRKLLEARANPDLADEDGNTPLHLAAEEDFTNIIDLLLKYRCNFGKTNNDGHTPLMTTVYSGNNACCRRLLEAGAWTEARRPSDERTALFLACEEENLGTINLLLKHKANPDSKDAHGITCLCEAASEGSFQICRALLGHGASVDISGDEDNDNALNIASWLGHRRIVELLLEYSADVHMEGSRGAFPLYAAASSGHTDVCQALLEGHADLDKEILHDPEGDWTGMNAVSAAAFNGHTDTIECLFENGASGQPPTALAGKWKNQPFADDVPMSTRTEILAKLREAKRTNGARRSSKLRIFGRA